MIKLEPLLSWLSWPPKRKMNQFFLEKKARLNKKRVIHRNNCDLLPEEDGRIDLGDISDVREALSKASSLYPKVEFCKHCIEKTM